MEGLCDILGTYAAADAYCTRYCSNWTNGFGWNLGDYIRHCEDPSTDFALGSASPSSSNYGDALFWCTTCWPTAWDESGYNIYSQSGIIRRWFYIMNNGGIYGSAHINPVSGIEHDLFVTMEWWIWGSISFYQFANATLDEYAYYYGVCSPQWNSCLQAWSAVNVNLPIPWCYRKTYIQGPHVALSNQEGTSTITFRIAATGGGLPPVVTSYGWEVPMGWSVSYSPDHSAMTLMSALNNNSQTVTCIVTYSDQTKDTLTTFCHILDGVAPKSNNNTIGKQPEDVTFYPNPMKRLLNVALPDNPLNPLALIISDITGREVYRNTITTKNSLQYIPSLVSAIYIAKITCDGKDYIKKLTVQ